MDIDVYFSVGGEQEYNPPIHVWHYHWARDQRRERQHYRQLIGKREVKGQALNIGDLLDDGSTRRAILNWDYEGKLKSVPLTSGAAQASIQKRSRDPFRDTFPAPLARTLLQEVQAQNFDSIRSLPDFLRESPSVRVEKNAVPGYFKIVAAHPDDRGGGNCKGCVARLVFDSAHGGLICRTKFEVSANKAATAPAPTIVESEVLKWSEPKPGVFIPMETRSRAVAPKFDNGKDKVLADAKMVVSNVRINEAVPDSAFRLAFPENAIVNDLTDPAKPQYHLWGPNDTILASSEDIRALVAPGSLAPSAGRGWRGWIGPLGCSALLVLLLGIWFYRKWRAT